jgi:Resolvase, N terminal domain
MQIGYMRVSKADGSQSTDLQRDALRAAGVAARRLYEDRASGRLDARPGLDAALKALRRGDTLIVWKLDRLGRDLRHLIKVIHDLSMRSIGFKVLTGHGASIDTTTSAGKLVFGIFASLAEFERDLISERTKAGLASARARGTKRRCTVQDDCGEGAPGHGRHGAKGNESGRHVQRTEYYPANALPACRAGRHATQGRAESRRRWADTESARKETVTVVAYPGFPSNCYSDPNIAPLTGWSKE